MLPDLKNNHAALSPITALLLALLATSVLGGCRTGAANQGQCAAAAAVAATDASGEIEDATSAAKVAAKEATGKGSSKAPTRYEEIKREALSFESRGVTLKGTLTLPVSSSSSERFPAVVILHDIGPIGQDGLRSASMGVELPVEVPVYELLAEELARSGVAVLRYDKRTCVKNAAPRCDYPREHLESARDDLAGALLDDAKAALKVARDHARVDPRRVSLLGHGQGATLALALRREGGPEAVILLAPSIEPIDALILHQTSTSLALTKVRREEEGDTALGDLLDKQIATLEADLIEQREAFAKVRAGKVSPTDLIFGMPASTWSGFFSLHDKSLEDLEAKHPKGGTLAIFGGLDLSLPPDVARDMEGLLGARTERARVEILDDVTHDMVFVSRETNEAPGLDERLADLIAGFLRTVK